MKKENVEASITNIDDWNRKYFPELYILEQLTKQQDNQNFIGAALAARAMTKDPTVPHQKKAPNN